ncbi:hypothetical protein D5S17_06865 [Pseudonocardiaceae bacterium YIM PH 21723]|nr:hypothetical protein D5S17_06865 [Pseudonocardiaceae bacterium YIM PH 21723]
MAFLNPGERRFAQRLSRSAPDVEHEFTEQLPHARRQVLDRLVGSLIREGLGRPGLPTRPVTATGRLAVSGQADHDPLAVWQATGLLRGAEATEFAADLADAVCQTAIARVGAQRRKAQITAPSSLAWAMAGEPSPLAFFEQWVIDGHPQHWAAKGRRGLTAEQALRYAPEWGVAFDAPLVAIDTDLVAGGGVTRILADEHPELLDKARTELRERGLDPLDYEIIPAHPWQAEQALPSRFAADIAATRIVPLHVGIPARPLMSFRTLAPVPTANTPFPSHLKTAIDLRLTMAVRQVSTNAAVNGPPLTALLTEILDRESGYGGLLSVQRETAGAAYVQAGGSLGTVVRANPEAGLAPGELVLPVAALYSESPVSGEPIIAEALDEIGGTRAQAAVRFAEQYARLVLPLLRLLTDYGVALEPHPQNTLVVLKGGLPQRLIVRDFGGLRVLPERLAARGLDVRLRDGSAVLAAGDWELRGKLFYSLITNHLGEVLAALGTAGGVEPALLWAPIRAVVDELPEGPDRQSLRTEPLPVKAFLRMRRAGLVTDSIYVPGPNPLGDLGCRS